MEMVPAVTEKLQASLTAWADTVYLKQSLIAALCTALGGSAPLDQDLLLGTALWSLACDGTPFLLTIQCGSLPGSTATSTSGSNTSSSTSPGSFPDNPPLLTITNVRCVAAQHFISLWVGKQVDTARRELRAANPLKLFTCPHPAPSALLAVAVKQAGHSGCTPLACPLTVLAGSLALVQKVACVS
jgi:hypothetical protein